MNGKKNIIASTVLLVWVSFCGGVALAGPVGVNLAPVQQKMSLVSLESLESEFISANKVVIVKGTLKNISNSYLRGYLTIFLMSHTGAVLSAFDLPINEHRPFNEGEIVSFDTAVNVSSVSGFSRVSVEFTKD